MENICTFSGYCACRIAKEIYSSLCGFGGTCSSQAARNRDELAATVPAVAAANTGSPKLFLLLVQEAVECNECTDAEKVQSIKVLISEQLRADA